jgi:hypothetical protein
MKIIHIPFNNEDTNGYGFFCDTDELSTPSFHKHRPARNYGSNTKTSDDNIQNYDIPPHRPISFFFECLSNEPKKYAFVCILSCVTVIVTYTFIHFTF